MATNREVPGPVTTKKKSEKGETLSALFPSVGKDRRILVLPDDGKERDLDEEGGKRR